MDAGYAGASWCQCGRVDGRDAWRAQRILFGSDIFVPFLLYHRGSAKTRLLHSGAFISICFLVVVTGSRAAGWAIFLQSFLHFLSHRWHVSTHRVVVRCLFLLVSGAIFPFLHTPRTLESRAEIWQTAWIAGLQHPFIGSGFGMVEYALHEAAVERSNNLRFQYVDSSHNFLLDRRIQGGVVGVGILVWLLHTRMKAFIEVKQDLYLCGLIGVIVVLFFDPVSVATLIHFWWLLGSPRTECGKSMAKKRVFWPSDAVRGGYRRYDHASRFFSVFPG